MFKIFGKQGKKIVTMPGEISGMRTASGLLNFGRWMASGFYPFMMGVHQLTL